MTEERKKHTSEECLAFALEELRQDPNKVKFHVSLISTHEIDSFNKTLWPGVFVETNWFRESTRRPPLEKDDSGSGGFGLGFGMFGGGTDKVVRTYNNELWEDYSHKLKVIVTEVHGELSVDWEVGW